MEVEGREEGRQLSELRAREMPRGRFLATSLLSNPSCKSRLLFSLFADTMPSSSRSKSLPYRSRIGILQVGDALSWLPFQSLIESAQPLDLCHRQHSHIEATPSRYKRPLALPKHGDKKRLCAALRQQSLAALTHRKPHRGEAAWRFFNDMSSAQLVP